MDHLGKTLVLVGLLFATIGALLWSGFGKSWLRHLPGDIHLERAHGSFHFPVVTCLLLSALRRWIN